MKSIDIQLQIASEEDDIPQQSQFEIWAKKALESRTHARELTIRIVDESESRHLNHQFRHKDKPTNVLSFPCDLPKGVELPLLGDLVICAPLVKREAAEQNKSALSHWAHLTLHGTLHLLGYDHETEADALKMEHLETALMQSLGFNDPYEMKGANHNDER